MGFFFRLFLSYDPERYCAERKIIRKMTNRTKTEKENFRREERSRWASIEEREKREVRETLTISHIR